MGGGGDEVATALPVSGTGANALPTFPFTSKASVSNSDVTTLPALNVNDTVSPPAFA